MKKNISFALLCFFYNLAFSQGYAKPDSVVTIFTKLPFNKEPKLVTVAVKDEIAYVEGDIVLGNIHQLTNVNAEKTVYCDICGIWPNSTIPYVIAPGFTTQMVNEINLAINQINSSTNLCIVPRTNQADYVKFLTFPACNSFVGRVGGEQLIKLNDIGDDNFGCFKTEIMHEIFHAAGLWHEQSREDRNNFVIIHTNNIIPTELYNFDQHINDGFDLGAYDFFSIMHYDAFAFTSNGQPTITRLNGSTDLGQGNDPTIGDIRAIDFLYGSKCGTCGNGSTWSKYNSSDPIFHWEGFGGSGWNAFSAPYSFNAGQFIKMDSGAFFQLDAEFGFPTTIEAGCFMEIYIDGCYGW